LQERLDQAQISAGVSSALIFLLEAISQGNAKNARPFIAQLSQKHWQEVKDWVNSLKAIMNWKMQAGM